MNPLSLAALTRHANLAARLRNARLRDLAAHSAAPLTVLRYHRVADSQPTDRTLSRRQFQRHLDYCYENFELIDVAEVQRRVRDKDSCTPAASITFDGGYRDNYDFALPLLIQRGIPCTYFVTTSNIRNQSAFAHDRKMGLHLAVNTVAQIREISEAGIEIGCHTRHHVDFRRAADPAVVRNEIIDAKDELEQLIGRAVRFFAFPFGLPEQLTQQAIETVHEAGYEGFCSAYGGYNLIGRDAFHIRRRDGESDFARFKKCLCYEHRVVRNEPEVRYFLPPLDSSTLAAGALATGELAVTSRQERVAS